MRASSSGSRLATDDALVMMRLPRPKRSGGLQTRCRGGDCSGPCGPTTASVANVPRDRERTTTFPSPFLAISMACAAISEPFPAVGRRGPITRTPIRNASWQIFLSEKQYQTVARSLRKYRFLSSVRPSTRRLRCRRKRQAILSDRIPYDVAEEIERVLA
jgi:hypothetical protein